MQPLRSIAAARFAYEQACREVENTSIALRDAEARSDSVFALLPADPSIVERMAFARAEVDCALQAFEVARGAANHALNKLLAAKSAARRARPTKAGRIGK